MTKLILSVAVLLFSGSSFAATVGVGTAITKGGYALDGTFDQGTGAVVHGQLGARDSSHELYENDHNHQLFANLDYDLTAPLSKNVSVYAGAGLGLVAARGSAVRLPVGIVANFDRFPVQVGYEMAPSIGINMDNTPHTGMFTDQMIAVRYLLK